MANNRMIIVCNKCFPADEWESGDDVHYIAKWYPVGAYYANSPEVASKGFYEYLERHAHSPEEDGKPHQESPVRLTYENWMVEPPKMKKYQPFKPQRKSNGRV